MGEGRSFKDRQQEGILYLYCGKDLDKGSMVMHHQNQHIVAKGRLEFEGDKTYGVGEMQRTYNMEFSTRAGPRPCPVKGCSGQVSPRTAMRVHF